MVSLEELQLRPTVMPSGASCNLACRYCYCCGSRRPFFTPMSEIVLEAIIHKFIEAYPSFISFCWHGGEPLLRGLPFFEHVHQLEECLRVVPSQVIENRVQTNATLITSDWAQFFKAADFRVGVSLDGPEWLNDSQRQTVAGKGTFRQIMQGIEHLRVTDVPFSVIVAVTKEMAAYVEELYRFVVEEEFTSVHLNPCFGNNPFSIEPMKYARFLNSFFDIWFQEDNVALSIGFFEDVLRWLLGGTPTVCHLRNGCCRHVKVDYNGDLIPCDAFLGIDFVFGNIVKQNLSEIVKGQAYQSFLNAVTTPHPNCLGCRWLSLCHGGCSRYSFHGSLQRQPNEMCESRKAIFEHVATTAHRFPGSA